MVFKKLASLISLRLFVRIALFSSLRASSARRAPSNVPSPAGRSRVCSSSGILGPIASESRRCRRCARAARRLCFFDFAVHDSQRLLLRSIAHRSSRAEAIMPGTHRTCRPHSPLHPPCHHRSFLARSTANLDTPSPPEPRDQACSS